jgi:thiol-disulfide isomerase/thioredoxin
MFTLKEVLFANVITNHLRRLTFVALGVLCCASRAADTGGSNVVAADASFAAFQKEAAAKMPEDTPNALGALRWREAYKAKINALGWQFLADFPADPRRWDAAVMLLNLSPTVVKSVDEEALKKLDNHTVSAAATVIDAEATAKVKERLAALDAQCAAATDMSPAARRNYRFGKWWRTLMEFYQPGKTDRNPTVLGPMTEELITAYPVDREIVRVFTTYAALFRDSNEQAYKAVLEQHVGSASLGVAATAKEGLAFLAAKEQPLDWKFTAADGREVDFAKLRGKVVLIDFWATWCAPCVAELPHLLELYKKYHDQGLEVVGITLEFAKVTPNDAPEQATAKLAKARQTLLDFAAKKELPWPHYFDGNPPENPYTKQFGIQGIPQVYLVNQDGKVVSKNPREKLEAEIRRLLKL